MMHHIRYLRDLLVHKWHVFRFCCRLGIPWRGVTHDLSRFLPDEWFVHARFFCGNLSHEEREKLRPQLDAAYARHIRRNDHHWQNPMSYRSAALREMLADWQARALYRDRKPLRRWYQESDVRLPSIVQGEVERLLPTVEKFR